MKVTVQTLALIGVAADDSDAFTGMVNRQAQFVFRVAWAVLRNTHDAEDVVQETFLRIYRARAWRRMNDERAFLARTAWRLAVDRKRAKQHQPLLGETVANAEQTSTDAVQRVIDSLPEDLRKPLILSALEEMTSREIAAAIGIPEGTVRTRIMRARQILKKKLENLHGR